MKNVEYKITENIHKQNQHGNSKCNSNSNSSRIAVASSEIIHNCVHFIKVMRNKCGIKATTKYEKNWDQNGIFLSLCIHFVAFLFFAFSRFSFHFTLTRSVAER